MDRDGDAKRDLGTLQSRNGERIRSRGSRNELLDRGLDGQSWDSRGSESISRGYRWILDIYPVFCCCTLVLGAYVHHIAIECILSIEQGNAVMLIGERFTFPELVWDICGLMMVVSRFMVRCCYCCGEEVV